MAEPPTPLPWGRHYLLCRPDYFRVDYAINPWMDPTRPVDRDRAVRQWEDLVATLRGLGAAVEELPAQPTMPDMVFTANYGLVDGATFVPARMAHRERADEPARAAEWLAARGWKIAPLPESTVFEGFGDALPFGDAVVTGWSARSSQSASEALARMLNRRTLGLQLRNPRFYHADLVFCPLDTRRAMVAPHALTPRDREALARLVPEPLWLHTDEAERMVANSIVVDRAVITSTCPPRVGRVLESWGFTPVEVDVSEFHLAGGSVSCLALPLDTDLSGSADATPGAEPSAAASR